MPYSYIWHSDEYPGLNGVRMCVCNIPAIGRFRGNRLLLDEDRFVPCNRWLCEQCRDDILDWGGKLRQVARQTLTPEQEAEYNRWYDDHGHEE